MARRIEIIKTVFIVLFPLLFLSCLHRKIRIPPPADLDFKPEVRFYERIKTFDLRSLRAEFILKMKLEGVKYRGKLKGIFLFERGEGVKIELYSPFNTIVSIIRITDERIDLLFPERGERYVQENTDSAACNAIGKNGMVHILTGTIPQEISPEDTFIAEKEDRLFLKWRSCRNEDGLLNFVLCLEKGSGKAIFMSIYRDGDWILTIHYLSHLRVSNSSFPLRIKGESVCGEFLLFFEPFGFEVNGEITETDMKLPTFGMETIKPLPAIDEACLPLFK